MTGRIHYTPEAAQQLDDLDEWRHLLRPRAASSLLSWTTMPASWCSRWQAGHATTSAWICTTVFRRRTLIAYEVDQSSGHVVVNVLGVFSGGQDWEAALRPEEDESGQR